MKVLAVGGAGYLGGVTTDLLIEQGHEVRVLDALLYEDCYLKPVDFHFVDVRNLPALTPHLQWADAVIWLAALVGDGACAIHSKQAWEINQKCVCYLVDSFDGRIVFPSTCSVYGAQDKMLDESSPTQPLSIYAQTKLKAEHTLKNKNALILRLGTLYGIGDTYSRLRTDLVVNALTARACIDNHITIRGGWQWRPLVHVRDVAQLIATQVKDTIRGTFNLAYCNLQIEELAQCMNNLFPNLKVERIPLSTRDARNYRVSTEKATQQLNFQPSCSVTTGIEEICKVMMAGRAPDPFNPRFSNQEHLVRNISTLRLD